MWICHNSAPLCQWIFRLFIIFLSSEMLRGHVHLWKDFFFLLLSDIFRIYSHRIAGQTKSKMRLGSGWVWPGCFLKTLYGRAITSRPRADPPLWRAPASPWGVQRGATGVCRRAQEVKVPFQGHKCTFQYCKPFAHLLKVIQFFVAPYWLSLTVHRAVILPDVCVRT